MTSSKPFLNEVRKEELEDGVKQILTRGKGILAADESTASITQRFNKYNIVKSDARTYRELLFTTPEIENYISAVIMFEETFRQSTRNGIAFTDLLSKRGILPGIKVDKGTIPLAGTQGEVTTQGLDDLRKRCDDFKINGAHFAKWRCVLKISENQPSAIAIEENAHVLACYASICQQAGLVPIVEPELLPDGTHDIEVCQLITEKILAATYKALNDHNVYLEGTLLKPNMVTPGSHCTKRASPEEIALRTITALRRTVPASVPGIVFLSGGQSEEEATLNLNAMNQFPESMRPWTLTFSYGRALQASTLATWKGNPENYQTAQFEFLKRAQANSDAQLGRYESKRVSRTATTSLYIANHKY